MDQKIGEACKVVAEKQQLLDSAQEELAMKNDLVARTRGNRMKMKAQLDEQDIDGLKHKLVDCKLVQDEKQATLEDLRYEFELDEESVSDAIEQKFEIEQFLKELQDSATETNEHNEIFHQRIKNEKNKICKIIQAKFVYHEQQIRQANTSLGVELREKLNKRARDEAQLEQLQLKKSNLIKDIETVQSDMDQKVKAKNEMIDQIAKALEQKQKLLDEKAAHDKEHKKLQNRQAVRALIPVDKYLEKPSDSDSSLPSSDIPSSHFDAEIDSIDKLDLETSFSSIDAVKKPKM